MIVQKANELQVTGSRLIADASGLLEAGRGFLRECAASDALILDLSRAEETDSSALSVIFGLLRTARERGISLRVACPPASMISQAALYGVTDSIPLA